jgi:hypothetical protein
LPERSGALDQWVSGTVFSAGEREEQRTPVAVALSSVGPSREFLDQQPSHNPPHKEQTIDCALIFEQHPVSRARCNDACALGLASAVMADCREQFERLVERAVPHGTFTHGINKQRGLCPGD